MAVMGEFEDPGEQAAVFRGDRRSVHGLPADHEGGEDGEGD